METEPRRRVRVILQSGEKWKRRHLAVPGSDVTLEQPLNIGHARSASPAHPRSPSLQPPVGQTTLPSPSPARETSSAHMRSTPLLSPITSGRDRIPHQPQLPAHTNKVSPPTPSSSSSSSSLSALLEAGKVLLVEPHCTLTATPTPHTPTPHYHLSQTAPPGTSRPLKSAWDKERPESVQREKRARDKVRRKKMKPQRRNQVHPSQLVPSPLHLSSSLPPNDSLPHKHSSPNSLSCNLPPHKHTSPNSLSSSLPPHKHTSPNSLSSSLPPHKHTSPNPLHCDLPPHKHTSPNPPSSSLPPLLISQLRKGGKCPSPSVEWFVGEGVGLRQLLPDQLLRVFVVTWNMKEMKELPDCLDDLLLPPSHHLAADLYVVGTQESCGQRKEWEILLQQTLGPSHVLVTSTALGVIYLNVFLRRDILWYCSAVDSSSHATRPGSMIKTKGGVAASCTLFGSSFLFLTSHFTAHTHKVVERNSDMQRIADNLFMRGLSDYDYVFWFGDLNYRVDLDREKVETHIHQQNWMLLLFRDQLTQEILKGNVFQGFSEQPINFPPTYKFDLNSDLYDSSEKKRTPSWTDRILYHSSMGQGITGCGYGSCGSFQSSDHKPVYAMFKVLLDPCQETDGSILYLWQMRRHTMRMMASITKQNTGMTAFSHNGKELESLFGLHASDSSSAPNILSITSSKSSSSFP